MSSRLGSKKVPDGRKMKKLVPKGSRFGQKGSKPLSWYVKYIVGKRVERRNFKKPSPLGPPADLKMRSKCRRGAVFKKKKECIRRKRRKNLGQGKTQQKRESQKQSAGNQLLPCRTAKGVLRALSKGGKVEGGSLRFGGISSQENVAVGYERTMKGPNLKGTQ